MERGRGKREMSVSSSSYIGKAALVNTVHEAESDMKEAGRGGWTRTNVCIGSLARGAGGTRQRVARPKSGDKVFSHRIVRGDLCQCLPNLPTHATQKVTLVMLACIRSKGHPRHDEASMIMR